MKSIKLIKVKHKMCEEKKRIEGKEMTENINWKNKYKKKNIKAGRRESKEK